jgi:hypothetical protein
MLLLIMCALASADSTLIMLGYVLVVAAVYRCVRKVHFGFVKEKPWQPSKALRVR